MICGAVVVVYFFSFAWLCSALLGSISIDANGCVRLIDNDDSVQFCVLLIQSHLIYTIHWTVFFFLWLYFTLYRSLKSTDFHFLQLIRLDRFNAIANKGICFRETICFCVFCSQFNWFFCSWKHHWAMRLGTRASGGFFPMLNCYNFTSIQCELLKWTMNGMFAEKNWLDIFEEFKLQIGCFLV